MATHPSADDFSHVGDSYVSTYPKLFNTAAEVQHKIGKVIELGRIPCALIVLAVERVRSDAMDTAVAWANALSVDSADISIFFGYDPSLCDMNEMDGLFESIRSRHLQLAKQYFPSAIIYYFADTHMRLLKPLVNYNILTRVTWDFVRHDRQILLCGFCRNPITIEWQHRQPDFGAHLWAIKAPFVDALIAQMTSKIGVAFDNFLRTVMHAYLAYTTYTIAGIVEHPTVGYAPRQLGIEQGVRVAFLPSLYKDDVKELDVVAFRT